jgi:hypothetical protein
MVRCLRFCSTSGVENYGLRLKIQLLVIDVFPPGKRDPQGIHKAIWDEFEDEDSEMPPSTPLTLAAYDAGPPQVACVEIVGAGNALPDMPLFLQPEVYVPAPLEATYLTSWNVFPEALKKAVGMMGKTSIR